MPDVGQPAPTFTLRDDADREVALEDLRGRPVVLLFYPKDDTPGCTTQARGIRDAWDDLVQTGATVLGVSPDSPESHRRFREKYRLPYTLLADEDHAVADAYGTWVEKNRYGRKSMGIERSTFVIDADGTLAAVKRRVKPDEHAAWALDALRGLRSGAGTA